MKLRKVAPSEVHSLQLIAQTTFIEAFGAENTAANMEDYLSRQLSEDRLLQELNQPDSSFIFAEEDAEIMGYMKINVGAAQTEQLLDNALELERIYVLQQHQGQGIGKLMYEHALHLAKMMRKEWLWLGVWEYNPKAIGFYQHQGLTPFDKHEFILGEDHQTDILMRLKL